MSDEVAEQKARILQANLESVVQQLETKTKQCEAATREVKSQQDLVVQMAKKLDVVTKKNKQLEKDNARFIFARDEMVSTAIQTEPDAQLLAARDEAAQAASAAAEAKAEGSAALAAFKEASATTLAAAKAEAKAALEAAQLASADAGRKAADLADKLRAAEAAVATTEAALHARDAKAKEEVAQAAAGFASELATTKEKLRRALEGESTAVKAGQAYVAKLQAELKDAKAAAEAATRQAEEEVKNAAASHAAAHSAAEEELSSLRARAEAISQDHAVAAGKSTDLAKQLTAAAAAKQQLAEALAAATAAAERNSRDGAAREKALQTQLAAAQKTAADMEDAAKRAETKAASAWEEAKRAVQGTGGELSTPPVTCPSSDNSGMASSLAPSSATAIKAAASVDDEQRDAAFAALREERRSRAALERDLARVKAELTAEMTGKSEVVATLTAQLTAARGEVASVRQWSESLEGKVQELTGDADNYASTISALQAALRTARTSEHVSADISVSGDGVKGVAEAGPSPRAEAAAVAAFAAAATGGALPPPVERTPGDVAEEAGTEGDSDGEDQLSREEARVALTAFYNAFNPDKLCDVEMILDKYAHDYTGLFERLRLKYNSEHSEAILAKASERAKAAKAARADRNGEKTGERLAAGWSSLMGGLGGRVKDAQEKVKEAVEKGQQKVKEVQQSGKLEELAAKVKSINMKDGLRGIKVPNRADSAPPDVAPASAHSEAEPPRGLPPPPGAPLHAPPHAQPAAREAALHDLPASLPVDELVTDRPPAEAQPQAAALIEFE